MNSQAQQKAQSKYDEAHTKQVKLKLNELHDADILLQLQTVTNKQGYIKALIRRDLQARDQILDLDAIGKLILPVARKHDLNRVYVFGSYARGEATIASDVDLLIEGGEQMGLLALGGVREDFRNAIGRKVDMVTMDALLENADARFTKNVLAERIKVYDKTNAEGSRNI